MGPSLNGGFQVTFWETAHRKTRSGWREIGGGWRTRRSLLAAAFVPAESFLRRLKITGNRAGVDPGQGGSSANRNS